MTLEDYANGKHMTGEYSHSKHPVKGFKLQRKPSLEDLAAGRAAINYRGEVLWTQVPEVSLEAA